MRRRALSLLLTLALLLALAVPGTVAYADDNTGDSGNKSGMEISKTATANGDGSYTITLEAYATGSKVISEITKDVPTDIILVLDQSGSMAEDIGTVSFSEYTGNNARNGKLYDNRHNGGNSNLWHKLEDGSYVSVSVTMQERIGYTEVTNGRNDSSVYDGSYTNLYKNQSNLYAKVSGEYVKVSVTKVRTGHLTYTYTYSLPDGTQIASSQGATATPSISGTDDGKLYLAAVDNTQTVYTYTYTDSNGAEQTIGTSTGQNTTFTTTLYSRTTRTTGGGTRLDALKNAVNNFANSVHTKSLGKDGQVGGGDDIDHRIALVGFSSSGYNNTELLTGSTISQGDWKGINIGNNNYTGYYYFPTGYEMNGPQYGNISNAQYKAALLPMNTDAGLSGVTSGVNALTAWGGTRTDDGLAMANKIFAQNPITNGEKRNRVVIVFTDGIPGQSGYDTGVASSAITEASTAKSTYGATVYTIGIFSGADATSAGSTAHGSTDADKGNYFLQRVSSNTQYPQSPSYYLSAADAGSLNSIFQQISSNIETGGSSSTLTSKAVVKDIISPQFTLPTGTTASDITLETYACTGKNGSDYTWSKNTDAIGAAATISGDQVSVTGFNFSENYVGTVTENGNTSYRGNKLVISFTVQPKAGFLGGNDVYTNTSAGIYENDSAENPLLTFDRPTVNVPIKDVKAEAPDKNVYLKGEVTADDLKNGATVKVDTIDLDLSKAADTDKPYGLEPWQTEYVDITVEIKDKDGNDVSTSGLSGLTDDNEYTVTVKVTPKNTNPKSNEGEKTTEKTGSGTGNINVFKPELTYRDSTAYYGERVVADFSGNEVSEVWKHGTAVDTSVTMDSAKPTLDITYTPDSTKLDGSKYGKQDVPVEATVQINGTDVMSYTTFVHQDCDPECSWNHTDGDGAPAFLIHIKTCTLNITKQGGADNESYVFDIFKDGEKYSKVTVEGNSTQTLYELPVGTYTIAEDTGWSWRYTANNGSSAELTAQNPTGSITCTNTKTTDTWLNGFSAVVRNIFGQKH